MSTSRILLNQLSQSSVRLQLRLNLSRAAETRKSLLRIAKRRGIVGRHNLTKEELVNVLSVD